MDRGPKYIALVVYTICGKGGSYVLNLSMCVLYYLPIITSKHYNTHILIPYLKKIFLFFLQFIMPAGGMERANDR